MVLVTLQTYFFFFFLLPLHDFINILLELIHNDAWYPEIEIGRIFTHSVDNTFSWNAGTILYVYSMLICILVIFKELVIRTMQQIIQKCLKNILFNIPANFMSLNLLTL